MISLVLTQLTAGQLILFFSNFPEHQLLLSATNKIAPVVEVSSEQTSPGTEILIARPELARKIVHSRAFAAAFFRVFRSSFDDGICVPSF